MKEEFQRKAGLFILDPGGFLKVVAVADGSEGWITNAEGYPLRA